MVSNTQESEIQSLSQQQSRVARSGWLRRAALLTSVSFAWSFVLAPPALALAHSPRQDRVGVRLLTPEQMRRMWGRQTKPQAHAVSVAAAPGDTFPWEGSAGDANTGNGNKQTEIPLVGWTQKGGMPVNLTLTHNSETNRNAELGYKWSHSYDIYLMSSGGNSGGGTGGSGGTGGFAQAGTAPNAPGGGGGTGGGGAFASGSNLTVHWGDDLSYPFANNGSNAFAAPTGIHDTLVQNVDGTFTLTKTSQVKYHFNAALYCDSITDPNGNSLSIARNAARYVTSVTDVSGRSLTFGYDGSNRITSVTDPLNRVWTLAYDGSGNLASVSLPVLNGATYTYAFLYDANHCLTDLKTPKGNHSTFGYNGDGSVAWEQDAMGNQTAFAYQSGLTTITDANGHATTHTYTNGLLTRVTDALGYHEDYQYDASNNKTQVSDKRGFAWNFTFDGSGNLLTSKDPYLNTTTTAYNAKNKPLTVTLPSGRQTVNTYDGSGVRVTLAQQKAANGTVVSSTSFAYNADGTVAGKTDANSHTTSYGYDGNGNLTSVTTPLGHATTFGYNALGAQTSKTDALNRTTIYTLDAWNRTVAITYPDSTTKTLAYDADGNLTGFTDATGTTTRSYDADNRLLSESKNGAAVVSHTYDATGQKGLLSTTTDANGRVLTYSYTSRNELGGVSEAAGAVSYAYDADGHETGISNPNGTVVSKSYDNAGQLTSVVNKTGSGSVLSSFSYTLDVDGRRAAVGEADGSSVSYGYDGAGRLTSETRSGTGAYSLSYVLDGAGNRLSQTSSNGTTTFAYDSDDELLSTSGVFTNSYGYNANGEQTTRTLNGTTYNLAFDFDGQISSIAQGANVVSFAYDAAGRRVSRTAGGTTTNFLYDGGQVLLETQGSSTTATYTYGNALVRKDGEFPLFDGQGSERTVTNSSQSVQGSIVYNAFGQTVSSTGSSTSPYLYAATSGYRNDGDAGLSHVGARYYDAQVGRFISRDTYLDQKPYLYCEHDPVNRLDANGHSWKGWGVGLVAGITVGILLSAAVDIVTAGAGAPANPVIIDISIGVISGGSGGYVTGQIDGNVGTSTLQGAIGGGIIGPISGALGSVGKPLVRAVAKFFAQIKFD